MTQANEDLLKDVEILGPRLVEARQMIARKVIGQEKVVDLSLIALLCGGQRSHRLAFVRCLCPTSRRNPSPPLTCHCVCLLSRSHPALGACASPCQ